MTARPRSAAPSMPADPGERQAVAQVLTAEYAVLAASLGAIWGASLSRTSLFLGVLSAVGVALGFVAQAGGGVTGTFTLFALVALPLALFLGVATFIRTVELQREAIVYIVGLNRIRFFLSEAVPASRPYFVLSLHDDEPGTYRSQGTGIRFAPPRPRFAFALAQMQGLVAVMCAALAAIIAGLLLVSWPGLAWLAAVAAFALVVVGLFAYWDRSIADIWGRIRPLNPTPDGGEPTI